MLLSDCHERTMKRKEGRGSKSGFSASSRTEYEFTRRIMAIIYNT